MKTVLCVYPPFCPPTSPPYSLTYIVGFLKQNTTDEFSFPLLDLNAWLHKQHLGDTYETVNEALKNRDMELYQRVAHELNECTRAFSKEENAKAKEGVTSKTLQLCLDHLLSFKPDVISMSIVYNSQAFFSLALAKALKEHGVEVIVGGPSVTRQLAAEALHLPHEVAFLDHITGKEHDMQRLNCTRILDYSSFHADDYATPEIVIPLRTTSCCYYQQCTFCTHHKHGNYEEYDLDDIRRSIECSKAKLVFIVDDMIHKKRLLALANVLGELNVKWMCQLKPTKDLDEATLKTLYDGGLRVILWGMESGNDRILALMKKQTNTKDIATVLKNSKKVGMTNVAYTLLGFPTETKEEFLQTIDFLKENESFIDLVSTTVFGLQEGAPITERPEDYGIRSIRRTQRKALPDKLSYEVTEGLHADEARILRKKYAKSLLNISSFPKEMNIYREHMLYTIAHLKSS